MLPKKCTSNTVPSFTSNITNPAEELFQEVFEAITSTTTTYATPSIRTRNYQLDI
jgi:hypothetical protein